jgi:hypothetical protein
VRRDDILAAWSGIRPLAHQKSGSSDKTTEKTRYRYFDGYFEVLSLIRLCIVVQSHEIMPLKSLMVVLLQLQVVC